MTELVVIDWEWIKANAPLFHNRKNQIRRAVGSFVDVYVGERCGTVRVDHETNLGNDRYPAGSMFDWWTSEEAAPGWPKIIIHPAR